MDFTADDLTANLMIWVAHIQTNGCQAPKGSPLLSHATAVSPRRKCPEVQTDLLNPCLGNIPPPAASFLPTNRAGPVGTCWKGTREGPWMERVCYNNARQRLWMGLQTVLLLRGAASGFPAPSPPPPSSAPTFRNTPGPKTHQKGWAKSVGAVFQKGSLMPT